MSSSFAFSTSRHAAPFCHHRLRKEDYLYTLKTTRGIKNVLSAYYDGGKIKDYTLYKIEEADGRPVLVDVISESFPMGKD